MFLLVNQPVVAAHEVATEHNYKGISLIKDSLPLGPYSRIMPRVLWWSSGGGALSYERGTPVLGASGLHAQARWHPLKSQPC